MKNIFHLYKLIYIVFILSRKGILSEITKSSILSSKIIYFLKIINFFFGKKNNDFNFGKSLYETLNHLGPAFVKLGQGLATRPDLIGVNLASELSLLQDSMQPFSTREVKNIFLKETGEFPEKLFKSFDDKAIAAASIAQVHKAISKKGEKLAIKILRPGIEKAILKDIEFFKWVAYTVSSFEKNFSHLSLIQAVDVFKDITLDEMDLRLEAAAADELRENFFEDKRFYIPKIYWSLTSKSILVLEWVSGDKINDVKGLIRSGHKISAITSNAAEAFFLQVFRDGFFHADMHPGNIFINNEGKLVPVDFGIMGRLKISDRIFLAKLLKAILDKNFEEVAKLHIDNGMLPANTSVSAFAQAVRSISTPILDKELGQISLGNLLGQLFAMASKWQINIQPQFLLLQKTMVMAEGVGRQISPKTNMWEMSRPLISEWLTSQKFRNEQLQEILSDLVLLAYKVPSIIEKIEKIELTKEKQRYNSRLPLLSLILILLILLIIVSKLY